MANEEFPALGELLTGVDRPASEFGGDDGLVQPQSKGHVLSATENAMLMRMVDPMDATGGGVNPGTPG